MKHSFKLLHGYSFLASFMLLIVIGGCKKESENEPVYLINSSLIAQYSKQELVDRFKAIDPITSAFIANGVKVYKISYNTINTDGSAIVASGALVLPIIDQAAAIISYQHGTITDPQDAPSLYKADTEAYSIASFFGGVGYIITCPDYLGYGDAKQIQHPYEHRESLATASLDMLRATRQFCTKNNINWDSRTYLAGYSQGGYATMSLFKKMEETNTGFNIRAVSCGAGAYNKTATTKYVLNNTTTGGVTYNSYRLRVFDTYNRVYNINKSPASFLKEPYATQVAALGWQAPIAVSFNQIFTTEFIKGINDGIDMTLLNAIKDNDVFDWRNQAPMRLYHSDSDELVPYFNSTDATTAIKTRGGNVELFTINGKNHTNAAYDYLLGTFEFFTNTK